MWQNNLEKVAIGTALTLASSVILPIAKSTLQPLATMGVQGSKEVVDRVKTSAVWAREEMEDIIAEAQFENMKKQFDAEIHDDS